MSNVTGRLRSLALQRAFGLDSPRTRDISIRRDVAVPMDDGVVLLADHYAPRPLGLGAASPAVVLVRSPYGRRGVFAALYGRVLAERGFQVFLQSCRGTAGSGGEFVPRIHEQSDGIATVRWLRAQPWCEGTIATSGMSYLGYAQYATATHPDADIAAMAVQVAMSDLGEPTFSSGFSFANTLIWLQTLHGGSVADRVLHRKQRGAVLQSAYEAIPLATSDRNAVGSTVGWYQDWIANPSADLPYWQAHSYRDRVPELTAPISMLTGWYDLFLPWMLRDHAALAAAGNPPELTIGPWQHGSTGHARAIPATTVRFLQERLLGAAPRRATPVRIHITGDGGGWRDLASWPPASSPVTWHVRAGALSREPADPQGGPARSRFTYDPREPTPAVGGPMLGPGPAVLDNSAHEARSDVVTFTSAPLPRALEVVGTPVVEVTVSASSPHHDVFVRLCDVDAAGGSWNVADRLVRLLDEPSALTGRTVRIELWPCGHRFAAGHRLRLQVSGGAHPRYSRNHGTGESLADATTMRAVRISVHHSGTTIALPVTDGS